MSFYTNSARLYILFGLRSVNWWQYNSEKSQQRTIGREMRMSIHEEEENTVNFNQKKC